MKIKVVAVGRIMPQLKEVQDYYSRRVRDLEVVEVKKAPSKEKEGKFILKALDGFKGSRIALDERGVELSSIEFSKILDRGNVAFVVGGADGLSKEVKDACDLLLSLSKMTLQHDIARVVLLEQIFRAVQILRGSPYHRG